MNRTAKWTLIGLTLIVGMAISTLLVLNSRVEERLNRTYLIPVTPFPLKEDMEAISRGAHLVGHVFFCTECHGENLEGKPHFDDPLSGQIAASNLTSGYGGLSRDYRVEDWIRAVRHGVGEDGKPLVEMPSNAYQEITNSDLGAIIAYVNSLPPVDHRVPEVQLGPLYRLSILADPSLLPAEVIEHRKGPPPEVQPGATAEYGQYLAAACTICHGEDLAGGPGAGAGLNLTPAGSLGEWTKAQFITALRTGRRPRGQEIDAGLMPIDRVKNMTDEELEALWLYLNSLPAKNTATE